MTLVKYIVFNGKWYGVYEKSGVDEFGYFVKREYIVWK